MSNNREFDVDPPEHLKHSVFAAIDVGEHTSPIAQPIAELVELPRRQCCWWWVELASSSCVRRKTRRVKPRVWNRCPPSRLLMTF